MNYYHYNRFSLLLLLLDMERDVGNDRIEPSIAATAAATAMKKKEEEP